MGLGMRPDPSVFEPYQLMPSLAGAELKSLRESIAEHGVQTPIVIDENGEIIDGHHRWQISQALGLECPFVVAEGLSEDEKRDRSIRLNMIRRNLSLKQKRKIAMRMLRENPERSNNSIAKVVGMSDVTIGAIRRELGLVSDVRVGADGKRYHYEPAPDQSERLKQAYYVSVKFESEADQLDFLNEMMERGLTCRASIF